MKRGNARVNRTQWLRSGHTHQSWRVLHTSAMGIGCLVKPADTAARERASQHSAGTRPPWMDVPRLAEPRHPATAAGLLNSGELWE